MIRARHTLGLLIVSLAALLGGCAVAPADVETSTDDLLDATEESETTADGETDETTGAEEDIVFERVESVRTAPTEVDRTWVMGGPYPIPWNDSKKVSGTVNPQDPEPPQPPSAKGR